MIVTDNNFKEILKEKEITIIDFFGTWCGPCKLLGPIIDELSKENKDITVGKVDVDHSSSTAVEYGVRGIPTTIFFKNGKEMDRIVGLADKAAFQSKIDKIKLQ